MTPHLAFHPFDCVRHVCPDSGKYDKYHGKACGSTVVEWEKPSSCDAALTAPNEYCDSRTRNFCITWSIIGLEIEFTMAGKTNGYISFGLTDTPGRMYAADSWLCWVDAQVSWNACEF